MAVTNRIRDCYTAPSHGVVVHPGIMYLAELADALDKGPQAFNAAMNLANPYLMALTIEEGREVARITRALKRLT